MTEDDLHDVAVIVPIDRLHELEAFVNDFETAWCDEPTTFRQYQFPTLAGLAAFKMLWNEDIADQLGEQPTYHADDHRVEFESVDVDLELDMLLWQIASEPDATFTSTVMVPVEVHRAEKSRLVSEATAKFGARVLE